MFSILVAVDLDIPRDRIENSAQVPVFSSCTHPDSDEIEESVPVFARTGTPDSRPSSVPVPGRASVSRSEGPHGSASAAASNRTIPRGDTRFE